MSVLTESSVLATDGSIENWIMLANIFAYATLAASDAGAIHLARLDHLDEFLIVVASRIRP